MARIVAVPGLGGLFFAAVVSWAIGGSAQPPPVEPPTPDAAPAVPAEPPPAPRPPDDELVEGDKPSVLEEALKPQKRGLTPKRVAARAVGSSARVASSQAELRAAAARVDQALAAYFPRASVSASYTRQSAVENDLGASFEQLFASLGLPPSEPLPVIVNVWSLTASLEVPLSDYATRLPQAYSGVTHDEEARALGVEAERRQAAADAHVAYYNWIRAVGQVAVADLATVQSELHLADARVVLEAGRLSEADVLRLEAQLELSRHLSNRSRAFERIAAEQLRTSMHMDAKEKLDIGVDIFGAVPPEEKRPLARLVETALKSRQDLLALRKTRASLDDAASAIRGGYYPRLSAFADGVYANPNPRIFPQENKWDFTWGVGVRLTWTVNETFTTIGGSNEAEAKAGVAQQQIRTLEDAIRMSVTQAYYDLAIARSAALAADKREEAARASLKARRLLFQGGSATATDMVDAEVELTQARLQRLDARVDLHVARTRLDHAIGRAID